MNEQHPSPEAVSRAAQALGRGITDAQAELVAAYLHLLIKWNRKMNLVGKSDWRTVFDTLIVDSLFLADFLSELDLPEKPLSLDLGAGAGLPGISLRALWTDGDYWLVEVREKRAVFMKMALGRLRQAGTDVFHGRAEDALSRLEAAGHRGTADLVLSRAFMPWPKLLEFVRPMLRQDADQCGTVVIMSNDPAPKNEELPSGWKLGDVASYPAAGSERFFWAVRPC